MTSSPPAIEVQDLRKVYHERSGTPVEAVRGISFSVPAGSVFGLLGPNGAGKTTTIKILTTLLQPTSGRARVMGYDVLEDPLAVRRSMVAVMQDNALDVFLSVRNNFRVYGRFHGLTVAEADLRADRVAELFGLREIMATKAGDLSGGQKRRVQVAKTFMVSKPVVFLDEATTGMDTFNKHAVLAAIRHEASQGRTIVLTTHLLEEAEELCERLAIINHGRIIASGTLREIKSMGLRLLTVTLIYDRVTPTVRRALEKMDPRQITFTNDAAILTVRNESEAMQVLVTARRMRGFRHFEVAAASLEDVFVALVDAKKGEARS
ncbi:MAG: ABC transporter ATP-binding protein [Bacteroidetes bacterium]|jgi:ABC-2 type transport system ATP-binding protein|nr:ABC transporter ATP-binding protein [Bacteroidota bacterium]